MTKEKVGELDVDEYLSLLNGKIEGLIMSVYFMAMSTMTEHELDSAHRTFIRSIEKFNESRSEGSFDHMPEHYVRGTLYVLEKVKGDLDDLLELKQESG